MIAISIVSHGHGDMVRRLIEQLMNFQQISKIIITINIPESVSTFPRNNKIHYIHNFTKKGYGANHNAAFKIVKEKYFCVLNPDIEFLNNPFPALVNCFESLNVELVAPLVVSKLGQVEDSMRYSPSLASLFKKLIYGDPGNYKLKFENSVIFPNWVAGMFMLFESGSYELIGGFDESFYMYYEDVDICERLRLSGGAIAGVTTCKVVHDARRASRRNFQHMRWHFISMLRYLWRYR